MLASYVDLKMFAGCESCGCNTDYAVGGTCDQKSGQCKCLRGVIGQNCDHCPNHWVLVVNETRTRRPDWKMPFTYDEGCFPCPSCVSDLLEVTDMLNSTLAPVSSEFRGKEAEFFALRRLKYIEGEADRLTPEIELLNPEEGSKRLEPLEEQVSDHQQSAKGLNVEYKMNRMKDMKEEAKQLEEKGRKAVTDMSVVSDDLSRVVSDMRVIADGLGSGVTPEQLNTSIGLGNRWLSEIKLYDFSEQRNKALEHQAASAELVQRVGDFAAPVEAFKDEVAQVDGKISSLGEKLADLKNNSQRTDEMVREAKAMNFRNTEPPAVVKTSRITALIEASKANNQMGTQLNNEADEHLQTATENFARLQDLQVW